MDAQTLQLRHRFGQGLLTNAHELAVVGDELYVCDTNNSRLQVFSLNGEHRRSVTGEWRWPMYLSYAKGRLYLVERDPYSADYAADNGIALEDIALDPVEGTPASCLVLAGRHHAGRHAPTGAHGRRNAW